VLLTLIAHAATPATRQAAFAMASDCLDPAGQRAATEARSTVRRVDIALSSPAVAAQQTAEALGLIAQTEPALAEMDYGRWAGQTLDDVATAEPTAVAAWLSDAAASPHDGESLVVFLDRINQWLLTLEGRDRLVVVTHPSVLRAAVLATLQAPPSAFWCVEAGPLGRVQLRGERMGWVLVGCAAKGL